MQKKAEEFGHGVVVDYKKAYDMVPHSWIIESLKMAQVAENIIPFLQKSMVNWMTELTSCGEKLGLVDIRRGIFQGDSLSPLIFVVCMVPLTKILQNAKPGYTCILGDGKINHLFFMDDFKIYGKNKAEIESLVSTVWLISQDIGMEFGIKKCGVVVLKPGSLYKSEGIKFINGQTIKEVDDEGYKYLGILELDRFKEREMKDIFRTEYFRKAVQTCHEISAQWYEQDQSSKDLGYVAHEVWSRNNKME